MRTTFNGKEKQLSFSIFSLQHCVTGAFRSADRSITVLAVLFAITGRI